MWQVTDAESVLFVPKPSTDAGCQRHGFLSFGWAPSAVGHIVRYDEKVTHLRAWARFLGTIGGATLALLALVLFHNLTALIYATLVFGSLNGLFKAHRIGQMPFFYTATIILLYSAFDIDSGPKIAFQRVAYNMAGIAIGLLVVLYPFPMLMRRIRGKALPDRNNAVVQ